VVPCAARGNSGGCTIRIEFSSQQQHNCLFLFNKTLEDRTETGIGSADIEMESSDKPIGVPVQLAWPIKQSSRPATPATPVPDDGQRPEQSNSKRRKTSDVWNHFTKNKDGPTTKAICLNCNATLSAQSNSGTNHLWRHFNRCKLEPRPSLLVSRGLQPISDHHRAPPRFNQEAAEETLTEMVMGMRLPFSIVEDTHFKEFASCLQPKFKMMDSSTLQASCLNFYKKRKAAIAKQLHDHPGKIALTLDVWSNQERFCFLKVTARYINLNWKLINRTLAFKPLSDPLDDNVIVHCITSVLEDWGIANKCGAITTESSTPNDLAVNKIREMLKERQILDSSGDYFHVRCGATAVQEMVQEALKTTESVIGKLRRLVQLVTHSEASEKSFLELAGNLNLSCTKTPSRDILSRWDSTYLMISEALTFRLAFEHLDATKPEYLDCPSPVEWLQLKTLKDALEVFHEAVGNLSSTDSPTANRLYLNMKKIERHLSKAEHYENNHSINIICPMANAFQKYWASIMEFSEIASVLDPRLKFQYLEFSLVKQHGATVAEEKLAISRNRFVPLFSCINFCRVVVEQHDPVCTRFSRRICRAIWRQSSVW